MSDLMQIGKHSDIATILGVNGIKAMSNMDESRNSYQKHYEGII